MNTTVVFSNPVLGLISSSSTQSSPQDRMRSQDELNDSIDLYIECRGKQKEVEIVRYLHSLKIQTKTDPQHKEHLYWLKQKQQSQTKMEKMFGTSDNTILINSSINRLLSKKTSETMNVIPQKVLESI